MPWTAICKLHLSNLSDSLPHGKLQTVRSEKPNSQREKQGEMGWILEVPRTYALRWSHSWEGRQLACVFLCREIRIQFSRNRRHYRKVRQQFGRDFPGQPVSDAAVSYHPLHKWIELHLLRSSAFVLTTSYDYTHIKTGLHTARDPALSHVFNQATYSVQHKDPECPNSLLHANRSSHYTRSRENRPLASKGKAVTAF